MKLISLNMEGARHTDRVLPFLESEQADTVCLLEAPELFQHYLQRLGYQTTFAPSLVRERNNTSLKEGTILASRHQYSTETQYYHGSPDSVARYQGIEDEVANPVVFATINTEAGIYHIATTHVMVTANGMSDEHQRQGISSLLSLGARKTPHVLCGDFNIPRGYNDQYERLLEQYTDAVPHTYRSSLDRDLHRLGNDPNLTDPIFDEYMVDYIFTQAPYKANDVHLHFGVSDHAAVVGTLTMVD